MTLAAFMRVTLVHSSTGRRFKQPDSALAYVTIPPQNIEEMIVWVKPEGLHNLNLSCHPMFEMSEKQRIYHQYIHSVKETKGRRWIAERWKGLRDTRSLRRGTNERMRFTSSLVAARAFQVIRR